MNGNLLSDMRYHFFEYRGLSIRYAVRTNAKSVGKPLLLFNGVGQSIEVMKPIIDALSRHSIVIFDVPGTGKSEPPRYPWRMRQHSGLAAALLDELGYETVNVMGFSWGGTLAQQFSLWHRERVERLILAAAPPGNLMVPGGLGVYLRMMNPLRFSQKGYMRKIAPAIYGGEVRNSLAIVDENATRLIPPSARGYLFQGLSMAGTINLAWLWRLKQPTLILQGMDDPMIPNINAKLMHALIPNCQLRFVGCGHMFMLTKLDEIVPVINAFLAKTATER